MAAQSRSVRRSHGQSHPNRYRGFLYSTQMPTPITPRTAGRPPRHPVDELRTRLWFHVVKLRSGLPSAYAIELALEPDLVQRRVGGVIRPRKWDGYESGRRVPRRITGKPYAVEVAEARFAGAAAYFESPMWAVLRGEAVTQAWIDGHLMAMSPPVQAILLQRRPRSDDLQFGNFDEASARRLAELGSFEALAAAVLLTTKSERIASPPLRELALSTYFQIQQAIRELSETAPFSAELFWAIDGVCKHWAFPTPQSRLEIVIFSDEIARHMRENGGA